MDEYVAKRGKRIEERIGDLESIASVLTEINQYDRAVEAEALDAFVRWCEGEGEEIKHPEGEAQTVWLAAWRACREAMQRPADEP